MSIIYIHLAQIIVVQSEINFVTIKKKSTISEKSIKKKIIFIQDAKKVSTQ